VLPGFNGSSVFGGNETAFEDSGGDLPGGGVENGGEEGMCFCFAFVFFFSLNDIFRGVLVQILFLLLKHNLFIYLQLHILPCLLTSLAASLLARKILIFLKRPQ